MSANTSPRPTDPDVHLSVFLHGARFDFAACLTAALTFLQEHRAQHYHDAVTIDSGDTSAFPRLPCERLYLDPRPEPPTWDGRGAIVASSRTGRSRSGGTDVTRYSGDAATDST